MTIDVSFTKGGQELFRTVTYAGYVGALTGVRAGAFSLSVDERDTEGALVGALTNAFEALFAGGRSIGFTLRNLLEEQSTFEGALSVLSGPQAVHLIAPVYIILGGVHKGEGAVVTRDRNADSHLWRLGDVHRKNATDGGAAWYVLETNYDWWKPAGDGRRAAAAKSMDAMTAGGVGVPSLWDALSTHPVLNDGTTPVS